MEFGFKSTGERILKTVNIWRSLRQESWFIALSVCLGIVLLKITRRRSWVWRATAVVRPNYYYVDFDWA